MTYPLVTDLDLTMRRALIGTIFVLFAIAMQACESSGDELAGTPGYDDPSGTASSNAGEPVDDTSTATTDGAPSSSAPSSDFGARAVQRGRSWIAAKMPYCGGPNGGADVICGGTCSRGGEAKNDAWDDYRSDCSGFVSYAWGLAAPGKVTGGFAPFDNAVSEEIDASVLSPGDALNNSEHVMLFGGWADEGEHIASLLQESRCGTTASEKKVGLKLDGGSKVTIQDTTGRVFYAVRASSEVQRAAIK